MATSFGDQFSRHWQREEQAAEPPEADTGAVRPSFRPRVGLHLGSGEIVQADVLAADAFDPLDIGTPYDVVAHMELDLRSDSQVLDPDRVPGTPTRMTASVRSHGNGRLDVAVSAAGIRDRGT